MIAPPWQMLASGNDGVFDPSSPWVMTSDSNSFSTQGVTAQNVIWLKGPNTAFKGNGLFLAVDSASGNSVTLRQIGQQLNVGMPPGPAAGVTGVTFTIQTLYPQIEEATYVMKNRFMIDEAVAFRASFWLYQGVEDPYREFRRAVVLQVLADRYLAESRTEHGDFEMKRIAVERDLKYAMIQVNAKFGNFGNSAEPAHLMGCKISR